MEASAFLQVCEITGVQAFGVIKGVSDMGDKYKGSGHTNYYQSALRNAAEATEAYVLHKLKEIYLPPPNES
jgi:nucleoside phosphorylase